jgi:hypothetical protein
MVGRNSRQATVFTMRRTFFRLLLTGALVVATLSQPFSLRADDEQHEAFYFHCPVPLGVDSVRLMPSKKVVYLLASAENQTLDGLKIYREAHLGRVSRVDGSDVASYPAQLDFRVTATSLPNDFQGVDQFAINSKQSMNAFLLGMKFKLKIFRGLKMKVVTPTNVKLIGVPSYQPYDERVYRVSFDTPDVPVDARMVLEVYDSAGTRLTRFHLEML